MRFARSSATLSGMSDRAAYSRQTPRWRAGAAVLGMGGVAWLALSATVSAALALPGSAYLSGVPGGDGLALTTKRFGIVPLTEAFIHRVLGLGTSPQQPSLAATAISSGAATRREASATEAAVATRLTITHPFTNGTFATAYTIPRIPFTARTNTRTASRQPGEPADCAATGGVAWYRYTAISSVRLIADTFGSDYANALGVFEGASVGHLISRGCNTGPTGNAEVSFAATKGHTYYFQVTGLAGGGDLTFDLAEAGKVEDVSVTSSGQKATIGTWGVGLVTGPQTAITPDGRFVAFEAQAPELRPSPEEDATPCGYAALTGSPARPCPQVYVHDRQTGRTVLASTSSSGIPGDGSSIFPSISADGRYVAFTSEASNLTNHATPTYYRVGIYVHDLVTGTTTREDLLPDGSEPQTRDLATKSGWGRAFVSGDGRYIAFDQTDLAPRPPCDALVTTCYRHSYLRDRVRGTTRQIGPFESDFSAVQGLTPDGRYALLGVHPCPPSPLAPGATLHNCHVELYRWDAASGASVLVSASGTGEPANGNCPWAAMSATGRYVAFETTATNLAPGADGTTYETYWHDTATGRTQMVSVNSAGQPARYTPTTRAYTLAGFASSTFMSITADGAVVDFDSAAVNLAPDANQGSGYVFRHDLRTGATTVESSYPANGPALTPDGRIVAFYGYVSADDYNNNLPQAVVKVEPS